MNLEKDNNNKEGKGAKITINPYPYSRFKEHKKYVKTPTPFEITVCILFLGWFCYCIYVGFMNIYLDQIVSNGFNVAVGTVIVIIMTFELFPVCIGMVLSFLAWFFGLE